MRHSTITAKASQFVALLATQLWQGIVSKMLDINENTIPKLWYTFQNNAIFFFFLIDASSIFAIHFAAVTLEISPLWD